MIISYEAKAFSQGRAAVMSIATALILWFHADVPMETAAGNCLKMMCDIGVDIFLFASGVGIYFAAEKYNTYGMYLRSRFRRILPEFLIVSIPWYAYLQLQAESRNWGLFWKQISTLSFWLDGDWSCWFVPAILLLYVLSPFLIKTWKRWKWAGIGALIGSAAFAMAIQHTQLIVHLGNQLIFLGRVPAYILGLCMGKAIRENRTFRIYVIPAAGVLAVSIFVIVSCFGYTSVTIPWVYRYFAYLPVMLAISLTAAKMPVNRLSGSLGLISLECYLLFEKIQMLLQSQSWMWPLMARGDYYRPLVAVILTLPAAALLRWLCRGSWLPRRALDKSVGKR